MIHRLGVQIAVIAMASASAGIAAAPAQADQGEYLETLQPLYVYLTPQQLLTEGQRVCAVKNAGADSITAINMVVKDFSVSVATAANIVSTAVSKLGC